MKNFINKFVSYISYENIKKNKLLEYEKKLEKIKNMNQKEFELEYINTKSEFENRKFMLSFILISLVITAITGVVSKMFQIIEIFMGKLNPIQTKTYILLVLSIIALFLFTVIVSLAIYIKNFRKTYKYLLILEEYKRKVEIKNGKI